MHLGVGVLLYLDRETVDIQDTPLLLGLCVILGRLRNPFGPRLPHLFRS